ncbi:MAG: valine--tRNA ligase [Acidimicrobiia bacterium]|nr:valine--tRNA ligase [Acidimicrobiia bacterium]
MAYRIPDQHSLDGLEEWWSARWEETGVYRFDRSRPRGEVFSIDTPPPTVSGSLHIGHVLSYTHTDVIARYRRMRGDEVFYPMGFDDNGLPTERRVQNLYGIRCDPSLAYQPDLEPPDTPPHPPLAVSRRNFIDLCRARTEIDEAAYEHLWRYLGLSVDWSHRYTTIDIRSQRAAQRGFLRNLARGEAYQQLAPVLWDVDFETAVAQAELEDRERPAALHRIRFATGTGPVEVETTRPELVVACVALVVHPDDGGAADLVGTTVRSPVFDVEVPVLAHRLADPGKGTGIAMVCTFGDTTDVVWWRDLDLPTRGVLGRDGRFLEETPAWLSGEAVAAYRLLAGRTVAQARRAIVDLMTASGEMDPDPRSITHPVRFYERGERPLEIVTSRQWYLRNGGRNPELRTRLRERGTELTWVPEYMRVRYQHWVDGLTGDWLISRQRFFGVPFPVWYPVGDDGVVDRSRPILPDEGDLPVDPQAQAPPGYTDDQRAIPGGFAGDPDVMDTWATSSLSPYIVTGWEEDPELSAATFPMDLRPQGHDIIRTWLFASVVRAHLEDDVLPWRVAALSGFVANPERRKMSKSKGNVVAPMDLLERYGSDGVRYWAARGRPGADALFDEGQMRVGRRLATKLLNASRLVLGLGDPDEVEAPVAHAIDRAMLTRLAGTVTGATAALEHFEYTAALDQAESEFWWWADNYLELVKGRARRSGPDAQSGRSAMRSALSTFLRLFAPFLPFVTEEVWSWWQEGSIHRAPWPDAGSLPDDGDVDGLEALVAVLGEVRRAKTEAAVSMRAPVEILEVTGSPAQLEAMGPGLDDLALAANAPTVKVRATDGPPGAVKVVLAPAE